MSKAQQLEIGRLRATPLGDWQQVVDLQQMGRGAAPPGERLAIAAASTVALPDVAPDRRGNVAPRWGLVAAVNRFACRVRRCSSRRAARSAVRGPAECRLRRRSGDRRARQACRAQRSQPPRPRPLLQLRRRSVRRQGTRQVPAPAPQRRPASPAHLRRHRSQPPRRRTRTAAPK